MRFLQLPATEKHPRETWPAYCHRRTAEVCIGVMAENQRREMVAAAGMTPAEMAAQLGVALP